MRVDGEATDELGCALWDERGQSTVEYAVVLAAGMAMCAALAVLWHAASGGVLLGIVEHACAYAFGGGGDLSAWQDLLLF